MVTMTARAIDHFHGTAARSQAVEAVREGIVTVCFHSIALGNAQVTMTFPANLLGKVLVADCSLGVFVMEDIVLSVAVDAGRGIVITPHDGAGVNRANVIMCGILVAGSTGRGDLLAVDRRTCDIMAVDSVVVVAIRAGGGIGVAAEEFLSMDAVFVCVDKRASIKREAGDFFVIAVTFTTEVHEGLLFDKGVFGHHPLHGLGFMAGDAGR